MRGVAIGIAEVPVFVVLVVGLGMVTAASWAFRRLGK